VSNISGFDLFISYSREDNRQGWISEILARIRKEYRDFAGGGELRVFFNQEDSGDGNDLREFLADAIHSSRLLLICLSPNYLQSEVCSWELNEYLKHRARCSPVPGNIGRVYFVEVPSSNDKDFEQRAAKWVTELQLREQIDFRPWFDEGAADLREKTVRDLRENLETRALPGFSRDRYSPKSDGNLDRRNEYFTGRAAELRRLREIVALSRAGVLTIINGPDGIGKTALAVEYGHIFAHEYAGRCWQIACGGRDDLRGALVSLAGAWNLDFIFTEEEKRNLDLGFKRVLAELRERADSTKPNRVLVVLDNVDHPNLLSPDQVNQLPRSDWLRIIATTRLEEYELFGRQKDRVFVTLPELPDEDGLALIGRHQVSGKGMDESNRAATLGIVHLLGGFTLAVEHAAIILNQSTSKLNYESLGDQLRHQGLTTIEEDSTEIFEEVSSYFRKRLEAVLRPNLKQLDEVERTTLSFASILPPDHVALPWLRALVMQEFPELGEGRYPGRAGRWLSVLQRLLNLRLLQATPERCELQMHRLVQEVIKQEAGKELLMAREEKLAAYVNERAAFLLEGWVRHEHRWELAPLVALAWQLLERNDGQGAYLANQVFGPLRNLGKFAEAEQLLRRAVSFDERTLGPDHPNVATCLNNLAALLHDSNRLEEAEQLYRRALAIDERSFGSNDGKVATCLNNLAALLYDTDRLNEAELLYRRALKVDERSLGRTHPRVATHLNNLAQLLRATDRPDEAEPLYRRALAIDQQVLGPNHPRIAGHLNNLAQLLYAMDRLSEAESLYRRALTIDEDSFGPDHPRIATHLNNLATLLKAKGRLSEAEPLYRRALSIDQHSFGADHPTVGMDLNNLAALLESTNRFPEAEQLMELMLRIFFRMSASTGQKHPFLRTAVRNYFALMGEMGCDSGQILARLDELARSYGISFTVDALSEIGFQVGQQSPAQAPSALTRYRAGVISLARKVGSFFGLGR
jgi:tetratricopeptide (TPR) repeat protein